MELKAEFTAAIFVITKHRAQDSPVNCNVNLLLLEIIGLS